ncbi:STAS/SEC14 domain-containing protein [Flavobacterium sp. DG2-3]|uniref:STAS/SEC14 domain-containing protein n=1 Tax=Flavobacterium sp. DG2-3 TaxID=3068317 RepID=UPI00273E7CC9|nr:STAS/SEC14 domain-containing protein [Flavobacterium sp. DG2-3]MDP5200334.1 STAS/SEC14 domain-containing protein [Flavobacterium sp. DG2-3]
MIQIIDGPENTAAFRAVGVITAEDYKNVLVPEVTRLVKKINEINFLLLIDTEIKNFTASAWMEDALFGLKNLGKWNRAAIVTDYEKAITFTKGFGYLVPGEFKGFKRDAISQALKWVETGEK